MGGLPQLSSAPRLPPPQVFRAVCAGLVVGAIAVGYAEIFAGWALTVAVIAALIAWRLPQVRLAALMVVGAAALLIRGQGLPPPPAASFVGHQVFEARVADAPRLGDKVARYTVELAGGVRVLLVLEQFPLYRYGDRLQVTCPELTPTEFAPYQARGLARECAFPKAALLAPARPSLRGRLLALRAAAGDRLRREVPEPYASLATGILWGDDQGLPRPLNEAFRLTGTSHLTAASGYNVMVVTEILFAVLVGLGLWRRSASVVVLAAVGLFVLFTGAEAAVVRAGTMGALLMVARLLGRRADGVNLLLGAAAAMLLLAPYLVHDLGFQLSFASMAGLMFLGPTFTARLSFLPKLAGVRESAAQTLAAIAATMPVVLVRLGSLSVVAPLANLAVAPLVPLVYLVGILLLPLGLLGSVFASPLAAALTLMLGYVIWVVQALARLPFASLGTWFAWVVAVIAYAGLARWARRTSARNT